MATLTEEELRSQFERLERLERELRTKQQTDPSGGSTLRNARAIVGAALLREHLGIAGPGEVKRARKELAVAEAAVVDERLMLDAVPGLIEGIQEARADLNTAVISAGRAKRLKAYNDGLARFNDAFAAARKRNAPQKDGQTLNRLGHELYELAGAAGQVKEFRKYLDSISNITKRYGLRTW